MTQSERFLHGEKGFLLQNGTFVRYKPVGVTWNDSFCRTIKDGGQPGCFVERNIGAFPIDIRPENNCSG